MEENGKATETADRTAEEIRQRERQTESAEKLLGKFDGVDALARAYEALEAEFTRRSQRLKALEERDKERENAPSALPEPPQTAEGLYDAVLRNEEVRARVVSDYLKSLAKGAPLMTSAGVGVTAPPVRAKTIAEAGEMALGYFRGTKK